jgi:hypothetical protein
VHNILIPLPFDACLRTLRLAVVFTFVPIANTFVCTGGVQDWTSAGLESVVPQLLRSVQVRVWEPDVEQIPHEVQDQFSVQVGGWWSRSRSLIQRA